MKKSVLVACALLLGLQPAWPADLGPSEAAPGGEEQIPEIKLISPQDNSAAFFADPQNSIDGAASTEISFPRERDLAPLASDADSRDEDSPESQPAPRLEEAPSHARVDPAARRAGRGTVEGVADSLRGRFSRVRDRIELIAQALQSTKEDRTGLSREGAGLAGFLRLRDHFARFLSSGEEGRPRPAELSPPHFFVAIPPPALATPGSVGSSARYLPLDVFRGIIVFIMVLVNEVGTNRAFAWLEHAPWQGWTLADFVFPAFLVIVGQAIAIVRRPTLKKMAGRSLKLWAWGLVMNMALYHLPGGLRLVGVLPRIAACSLAGSLIFLETGPVGQALAAAALLAGYWLLMTHIPVPGFGAGVMTPEGNLASYLDRLIMPGRLSHGVSDPEGLLSTLPALANVLMGTVAGQWIASKRSESVKIGGLLAAGALMAAAGLWWGQSFLIIKEIWTSSYALFMGGAALIGFALTALLLKLPRSQSWTKPFELLGRNALPAYFLSGAFYALIDAIKMPVNAAPGNLRLWIVDRFFARWLSPGMASLAFTLLYAVLFYRLMASLDRRNVFSRLSAFIRAKLSSSAP